MTESGGRTETDGVPARDTGTPFSLPAAQVADALEALEFEAALERVAAHAAGLSGAAEILARRPTDDAGWIAAELALVAEALQLEQRDIGLAPEPVPEVREPLARLRVHGSVLEAPDLFALYRLLMAGRLVVGELDRVADEAPGLARLRRPVPERKLERRLELSVDAEGTLLDTASPKLAAARQAVQHARERLVRKLESLLRAGQGGEAEVTVRNGRYVIPVRRDTRQKVSGIIHGESSSGGTLFVEPAEAVELGNELREAETAAEREALRVLRELTDLLRPHAAALVDLQIMAVAVDSIVARARYAASVGGHPPQCGEGESLRIREGRHPLLFGGGNTVVSFDLALEPGERTLIISGPNTGGKTVLLKAVGLLAALVQSGVVPPVGPGTVFPVFRRWFTDIGDRQSIAASLSTFSAHVQVLRQILDEADGCSLVLLDEVGGGTDPVEGAALAGAVLRDLTARGSLTLASTHLGSLKQLAQESPGIVNASLEFDAARLEPTYRFLKGVPGRSYGLAIAERLGLRPDVLRDARERVPEGERRLDELLAAAETREREAARREEAAAERQAGLEALSARLEAQATEQAARQAELDRRDREAERRARSEARSFLLNARRRVEEAVETARGAADEAAAREARRMVEESIREETEALARSDAGTVPAGVSGPLAVGQRVRLGTGATGVVQELRGDGRVAVLAGSLRLILDGSEVVPIAGAAPAGRERARGGGLDEAPSMPGEIDLRGLTGDEAEAAVLAALDGAVLAELPSLRIIHGKGTGVVRERVRQVVSRDRRVSSHLFAPANQGGTGVTIVEFAP